tara:strand:+ start:23481 stop:23729 length:249 start_codon:yes stop_codon:yes gene_type:complete
MKIQHVPIEVIWKTLNLKEHKVYKIKVKTTENNVEHIAFLFTGFKTGGYCMIYTNSYEQPIKLQEVYSVEIIKKIASNKKTF